MKYYSEEHMGNIRLTIEKTLLDWPETTTKKMLVTKGIDTIEPFIRKSYESARSS